MFVHDLKLALVSCRRTPMLSALMVIAVAVGMTAFIVAVTQYLARAGHPIPHKEGTLFAVTLDSRDLSHSSTIAARRPEYPPFKLFFRDAQELRRSTIPQRSVVMYWSQRLMEANRTEDKVFGVTVRATTGDFFSMFDAPFRFGGGWSKGAEANLENVVVLGHLTNERLFGEENSVGREVRISNRVYRVVGVLDQWLPRPRFYDPGAGFSPPEDIFMPFDLAISQELPNAGEMTCARTGSAPIVTFKDILAADCNWVQMWAELAPGQKANYQQFLDNYVRQQREFGRFPRPLNNRLASVSEWMEMNDVVGSQSKTQLVIAVMFLLVCALNTMGLMLARFLRTLPVVGLRRALGATRKDIFRQYLIEALTIACAGGVLGTILAVISLALLSAFLYVPMAMVSGGPEHIELARSLSRPDARLILIAVLASISTGVFAGLYPAWRIGRAAPAAAMRG